MKKFILDRMKERSTYVGIAIFAGMVGFAVDAESLFIVGTAIAGLIQTFIPDPK